MAASEASMDRQIQENGEGYISIGRAGSNVINRIGGRRGLILLSPNPAGACWHLPEEED